MSLVDNKNSCLEIILNEVAHLGPNFTYSHGRVWERNTKL